MIIEGHSAESESTFLTFTLTAFAHITVVKTQTDIVNLMTEF